MSVCNRAWDARIRKRINNNEAVAGVFCIVRGKRGKRKRKIGEEL